MNKTQCLGLVLLGFGAHCSAVSLSTGPVAAFPPEGTERVIWCVAQNLSGKTATVEAQVINGSGEIVVSQTKAVLPFAKEWVVGMDAVYGGGLVDCRFIAPNKKIRGYLQVQDNYVTTLSQEAR